MHEGFSSELAVRHAHGRTVAVKARGILRVLGIGTGTVRMLEAMLHTYGGL